MSIEEIYDQVPSVKCKGLCHKACGPIMASEAEVNMLREKGIEIGGIREDLSCDKLCQHSHQCTIYDDRPLICRLWGAVDVDGMRCPFGCKPEEWLSDSDGKRLLREADKVVG